MRPGESVEEAAETCPVAVGFYSELNDELQSQIYAHYTKRVAEQKPVMYLLLPEASQQGQVVLVLPTEGGLRQRQIQRFGWSNHELPGRLSRLQQGTLRIADRLTAFIPQVDWVFYPGVKTAEKLAQLMAEVAKRIEQAIPSVYKAEKAGGYLHKLFESFKKELLPTLKLQADNEKDYSFADIYAQTVAYGLFTARVFGFLKFQREKEKYPIEPDFYRDNAWSFLPETNPFLRKLFEDISQQPPEELGEDLISAVSELLAVLRAAEMEAVLSDFEQKIGQEDIIIRFYEDFLKAYKPQMRERRGVYYTPEPVVSYIVSSVDYILKKDFGLKDGLADAAKVQVKSPDGKKITETHKVLITDPAVGTGTFLHEVINHIHKSFKFKPEQWSDYVAQDLLPRLLGFELLMAPYAVAHMKLGLQLAELGYQFGTEERLRVYLTNTLQEAFRIPPAEEHFSNLFWGEADAANRIKEIAPVMVILGNPPYSGHSANNGDWIKNLLKGKDILTDQLCSNYFEVDGNPLGEKNPKWLNDDYVKFIRFGQWRIEKTGYGVLAFVTNHAYLDNPTFRGMRQSLMETFDDIYVLDLHGNSKKKESCPNGSKDENVFDIQQGVSINIFVKHPNGNKEKATVHHADLWGERNCKYNWLGGNDITTTQWNTLQPQSPFYLFVPQNTDLLGEYQDGSKITEAMPTNGWGIATRKDYLLTDFTAQDLTDRMSIVINGTLEEAYTEGVKDNESWSFSKIKNKLGSDIESRVYRYYYRPFDYRYIFYEPLMIERGDHRLPIAKNFLHEHSNLSLLVSRTGSASGSPIWDVIFVGASLSDLNLFRRGGAFIFPLYLYPDTNNLQQSTTAEQCCPNFSEYFLAAINNKLGYTPTPEAIFYYIYAIFHSPTYRTRYAEFLKIDFPRVPLTSNDRLFRQLAVYGEELVALHLMKSPKLDNTITQFCDRGGSQVVDAGHPKYQQSEVIINKKGDCFTGVPENVWNFHVGGYQVCHKWLKDRKGRTLSDEDILHYQRIVIALQQTIQLMAQIDAAIPGFPIQ